MNTFEITTTLANWTGAETTIDCQVQKDGKINFEMEGEEWVIVEGEEGSQWFSLFIDGQESNDPFEDFYSYSDTTAEIRADIVSQAVKWIANYF